MVIQFFIPLKNVPTVTYQQKDITVKKGKPIMYEPAELKDVRSLYECHLAAHAPKTPITSGVRLTVKWLFGITGKHQDGEYKLTRPDTDNMIKMLKDAMTDVGFWKDDSLVCSEVNEKFYSKITGIFIRVETVTP